ncbi:MAG: serine/threonine protein kinase [Myxococcota bacterium]
MAQGSRLGKYRVVSLLASGGMGEVFLARQEGPAGFAKTVVVKKILRHLASDQSFIDMFVNEARLAALLTHHNIAQIFELGQEDDTWFIAMEYVHGKSLRAIRQRLSEKGQRMPANLAARLCAQALTGLHHAHGLADEHGQPLGIVHRDISPDNLLVSFAGVVKVVDFGIAKAMARSKTTHAGTLKGKYLYMAPEQLLASGRADPRTDVYAVGVLLYELVTGLLPFDSGSVQEKLDSLHRGVAEAPIARDPSVPQTLSDIVMRALASEQDQRFASAEEMANALESFLQASAQPTPASRVAQFLKELFPEDAQVSPMVAGEPLGGESPGPMGTAVIEPNAPVSDAQTQLIARDASFRSRSPQPMTHEEPPAAPRSSRWPTWVVAFAAVGVLVVAAGGWLMRPRKPVPPAKVELAPLTLLVEQTDAGAALPVAVPPVDLTVASPPADAGASPVEVRATPVRVRKKPKPGRVTVRVNPWAEVFYEGKRLGITPMPAVEVPAGVATFTLRNKELKVTRKVSVRVPAGGVVVLKADLFDKKKKSM